MPQWQDLPEDFRCPYRDGCPYLEGLSTGWVFHRYQQVAGTECHYEYQLEQLHHQLEEERQQRKTLEQENQQLRAQLQALHRRQFKGRKAPATPPPDGPAAQHKQRGAPVGHPPWQRAKPKQLDLIVPVPAPKTCPHCQGGDLQPVQEVQQHVQEDIVLEPRTLTTGFLHQQAYCTVCERNVVQPGPGELLGAYIGPAAKATAIYMRYELNVPDRKISRFFADFFGLKFVPASAFGFERQAVRRGLPLYADLLDKVRSLPVAHADETSWRHDGRNFFVWFAGDADLAAFVLQQHRSTEAAQAVLGEHFGGVLVADAYASYNGVHPKARQSCLAPSKPRPKNSTRNWPCLRARRPIPKPASSVRRSRVLSTTPAKPTAV